jgi:hypothetical protein
MWIENPNDGNHGQELGSMDMAAQLQADPCSGYFFKVLRLVIEQDRGSLWVELLDELIKIR